MFAVLPNFLTKKFKKSSEPIFCTLSFSTPVSTLLSFFFSNMIFHMCRLCLVFCTHTGARHHARRRRRHQRPHRLSHRANGARRARAHQGGALRADRRHRQLAAAAPAERPDHQLHGVHPGDGEGPGAADHQGE